MRTTTGTVSHQTISVCNQACAALIKQDESLPRARRLLAKAIRAVRNDMDQGYREWFIYHAAYVGWPIRMRPNGRHS